MVPPRRRDVPLQGQDRLPLQPSPYLRGILSAAFDYHSALEWVIDQYRVSTDPRSGIVNDPNRLAGDKPDPTHILRLIRQVITVSIETQQLIAILPSLNFPVT